MERTGAGKQAAYGRTFPVSTKQHGSVGVAGCKLALMAGGEEAVVEFVTVTLRERSYLFFVVSRRPFESSEAEQRLEEDLSEFGRQLGREGAVIRTYPENARSARQDVLQLAWPRDVRSSMEETEEPFMMIINRDYRGFDPQRDPWAIVWLKDREPGDLVRLFQRLADEVLDGADLFEYLGEVAKRARRSGLTGLLRFVEFKPKVLGVSIDITGIARAIPDFRSASTSVRDR